MKYGLLVFVIVSYPFLSFGQNGSVSFGVSGAAPTQSPNSSTTSTGMGFGNNAIPQSPPCHDPMDGNSFKSAKQTVAKASYEETKLSAAKAILTSNCLNADQVIQICKLFGFEQSKLDFAKSAYAKTTDRAGYSSKVAGVFTFDASKKSLNDFISNGGK